MYIICATTWKKRSVFYFYFWRFRSQTSEKKGEPRWTGDKRGIETVGKCEVKSMMNKETGISQKYT